MNIEKYPSVFTFTPSVVESMGNDDARSCLLAASREEMSTTMTIGKVQRADWLVNNDSHMTVSWFRRCEFLD